MPTNKKILLKLSNMRIIMKMGKGSWKSSETMKFDCSKTITGELAVQFCWNWYFFPLPIFFYTTLPLSRKFLWNFIREHAPISSIFFKKNENFPTIHMRSSERRKGRKIDSRKLLPRLFNWKILLCIVSSESSTDNVVIFSTLELHMCQSTTFIRVVSDTSAFLTFSIR